MCLHSNIIRGIQPLVSSKIVDRGPGAASGPRSASASPQLFFMDVERHSARHE